MNAVKTVEEIAEGATRRRGGRAKAVEAAQKLVANSKKAAEKASTEVKEAQKLKPETTGTGTKIPGEGQGGTGGGTRRAPEDTEPAAPELTPEQEELIERINRELHEDYVGPSDAQVEKAPTKPDDVRTRKIGGMRKIPGRYDENYKNFQTNEWLAGNSRDNTQVTDTVTHPDTDATKPDKAQTAQPGSEEKRADHKSGDEFNPLKYAEKAKDNNLSRSERQMYGRLWNMRVNAQKVFDKGTDEQIRNELGRWGIEAKAGTPADDYMKEIDEMLKKKAESGPTIGDKFIAHHGVGLTGLGVVGVSTLDLANSRGQQSNAQLYSDPFA